MTSSVALGIQKDKIGDQKKDNVINLLDSLIRRNKEGDDDDVMLGDDEMPEVVTDEFEYDPKAAFRRGRLDYIYNREGHKLKSIFFLIAQPDEEEKLPLVVLKIIDGLLIKNIPKILDFFIFTSLKRVLMRTDWLKPASETVEMA